LKTGRITGTHALPCCQSRSRTYVIWRDRLCIGRKDFNKL
jgi:hypothetical protein